MGFAFAGLADDVTAIFYNPAGLWGMEPQFISGFYDLDKKQFSQKEGWAVVYNSLVFGQFLMRIKNDELARFFLYGLGFNLGDLGQAGVTYRKFEAGFENKFGWTMDVGVLKKNLMANLNAGINFKNVFKENFENPVLIRTGLAYFLDKNNVLTIDVEAASAELKNFKSYRAFYGFETKTSDNAAYRIGWSQAGWSAGVSLIFPYAVLEYALIRSSGQNETIQSFGIKLGVS